MSETLNKLHRISGVAGVITKIIMALLIIAVIAAVAILVVVTADIGSIVERMAAETAITKEEVQAATLNAVAVGLGALAILYFVNRLFTNVHKNNALFTDDNVRDLRLIALMLVIAAAVFTAVTALTMVFLLDTTDVVVGFSPLSMLLTAFIVYIVSLIFSYGTELQKQSDETL